MDDTTDRAQRARETSPFLTTKQTAYYLRLSPATIKKMRADGRGPACRLHSNAWFYHIDDVEAWSKAKEKAHEKDGDHGQ